MKPGVLKDRIYPAMQRVRSAERGVRIPSFSSVVIRPSIEENLEKRFLLESFIDYGSFFDLARDLFELGGLLGARFADCAVEFLGICTLDHNCAYVESARLADEVLPQIKPFVKRSSSVTDFVFAVEMNRLGGVNDKGFFLDRYQGLKMQPRNTASLLAAYFEFGVALGLGDASTFQSLYLANHQTEDPYAFEVRSDPRWTALPSTAGTTVPTRCSGSE